MVPKHRNNAKFENCTVNDSTTLLALVYNLCKQKSDIILRYTSSNKILKDSKDLASLLLEF